MSAELNIPEDWQVEGNWIYAPMIDGWRNGHEVRCNRFTAIVHSDRRAPDGEAGMIARLMGSAPDLLSAVEAAMHELTEGEHTTDSFSALYDTLKAAHDKAKGVES